MTVLEDKFNEALIRAESGGPASQYELGGLYMHGWGTARNEKKANRWFNKAIERVNDIHRQADSGDVRAQNSLGRMYKDGHGVVKNAATAEFWYRKAAEQGYAQAQCNLGLMYERGQGVACDMAMALRWHHKAAEQGYAIAQSFLGMFYNAEDDDVEENMIKAVQWYRKAAEQGLVSAQYELANLYENGRGVAKDMTIAVEWYRKAAEQGDWNSQVYLGRIYGCGDKVPKDYAESVRWYRKAAGEEGALGASVVAALEIAEMEAKLAAAESKLSQQASSGRPVSSFGSGRPKSSFGGSFGGQKQASQESRGSRIAKISINPADIDVREFIAEGTYGRVDYGKWKGLDVALKTLKVEQLSGRAEEEFLSECEVMMNLRAQWIIGLYGVTLSPPSMVMEYLSGGSLDNVLQSTMELSWEFRHQLALDIVRGLTYLHSQTPPIVHRDLKSLNIILNEDGRAKIGDFGLARVKSASNRTTTVSKKSNGQDYQVGTELWMAPELLNPQTARYTTKSDMYSFGLILWEIAAREYPYRGANNSFALVKSWKEQGQEELIPDDTPAYFAQAIEHCRALNPKNRPDAAEMIRFLEGPEEVAAAAPAPSGGGYADNFGSASAGPGSVAAMRGMFGASARGGQGQEPALQTERGFGASRRY